MMDDFTPIETQEAFDAAIAEKLAPYADYDAVKAQAAELAQQLAEAKAQAEKYAGYDEKLAALQKEVRGHETRALRQKIAYETGIPFELADRIRGESEEDIRKDAALLSRYTTSSKWTAPLADTGPAGKSPAEAAMRTMLQHLTGDNV